MSPGWLGLTLVGCAAVAPVAAQTTTSSRIADTPKIAIADGPDDTAMAAIDQAGALRFPIAVRVEHAITETAAALDTRLDALAQRKVGIWLTIDAPAAAGQLDGWRAMLRGLAERLGDRLAVLEIDADQQPAEIVRFALQAAAIDTGRQPTARVALGGAVAQDPSRRVAMYSPELAAYVDLLAVPADQAGEASRWLASVAPQARLALLPGQEPVSSDAVLQRTFQQLGSNIAIQAWRSSELTPSLLRALDPAAALLTHAVSPVSDAGALVAVNDANADAASVSRVLLFDQDTFSTYLAYWTADADATVSIELSIPLEATPRLYDLLAGSQTAVPARRLGGATSRVRVSLPLTGRTMLVDFNDGATPFADRSEAIASRQLTVAEIIARHQRQQRRQDESVTNFVAAARMEQHFRPTIADPGYDVVTENTYFSARDGVEWQERSFSVNGSKWGANRPPFPILQPEKVLALPLQLRFDEGYKYTLAGVDRIGGIECYVVKFDPIRNDSSLYQGTVWIDRTTFARIRVHAVQSRLAAPVISNDETQDFTKVTTIGNEPVYLLSSLTARQLLLVAGRNLLVEKKVSLDAFRVNDPDFEQARALARDSDAVMFRETPLGLRYYVKDSGRRVVRDQPTRDLKALAMGVTLDPSYGFPLPIVGINYLNFNFGDPNTQLAVLFAGVLAAGNIQRANLGARNIDASIDFFGIAAPSSDRLYLERGEDPTVRVLTWPLSTGVNIGWQATPFMKATLQYQFHFDGYVRDRTTSADFVTPTSTVTNGIGGAWEYRRAGYSLVGDAAWFRRAAWRSWGQGGGSTSPTYAKYSAALSRDLYLNPFQKLHFNVSWFGSSDVDRFGKYQFGLFDNTRIHGVPASGVKLGEVAMARGSYSVNIFEQYRVDLFLEHAWGRDEAGRGGWETIPAVGLAINVRAPWDTILRVDGGKSFLPSRYNRLGSATLQIMLLKPLR